MSQVLSLKTGPLDMASHDKAVRVAHKCSVKARGLVTQVRVSEAVPSDFLCVHSLTHLIR